MQPQEIKRNLNKLVEVESIGVSGKYKLTGCIYRRRENTGEFYYQAELQDLKCNNSIVICKLEDVKEIVHNNENVCAECQL